MFSTHWLILARVTPSRMEPLYSPSRMETRSTSKAAEEESPDPESTREVTAALKPPMAYPMSCSLRHTPRMRASVVFFSASFFSRSRVSTTKGLSYPCE